jgi:hypothetical protein
LFFFFLWLDILPSSYNLVLTDLILHEYWGIAQFYFYNLMGWNKPVLSWVKCEQKKPS